MLLAAFSLSQFPDPVAVGALISLMVVATHRESFFSDETALSGSFIVVLAAVVVFVDNHAPLGFAICAAFAGIHLAHIRTRSWSRLLINASVHLLSASLAAVSYTATTDVIGPRNAAIAVAMLSAVLVYWIVNNLILATVIGIFDSGPIVVRALSLIRSETEMLVFALAGAGCGYLMVTVNLAVGLLGLVGLLIVVDVVVIRRPRLPIELGSPTERMRSLARAVPAGLVIVVGVVLTLVEPLPPLSLLLPLLGAAVLVGVLGRHAPLGQHLEASVLVSLTAVGALHGSSPLAGPALIGLAGGLVIALTHPGTPARRLSVIALAAWPAIAATSAATALPVDASGGLAAALATVGTATLAALLARALVSAVAVATKVKAAAAAVAIGDLIADAQLAVAGMVAALTAWYSLAAGLAVAAVAIAVVWLVERRRTAQSRHGALDSLDRDELLTAITVALCDRPGSPSSLPS